MDPASVEVLIQQAGAEAPSREAVQVLLSDLAKQLGLPALALDEDATVEVEIDDDLPLTLTHLAGSPTLIASAPVLELAAVEGGLLQHLLRANLSTELMAGAVFGIAADDETLRLCRQMVIAERDATRLGRELNAFIQEASVWTDQIQLYLDAQNDEAAPSPAEPAPPVDASGQPVVGIKA